MFTYLEDGDIVVRDMISGDPILFNRQPTLDRSSMGMHVVRVQKQLPDYLPVSSLTAFRVY
jgi:DNA-directed RNA polymerase beta' subunit